MEFNHRPPSTFARWVANPKRLPGTLFSELHPAKEDEHKKNQQLPDI